MCMSQFWPIPARSSRARSYAPWIFGDKPEADRDSRGLDPAADTQLGQDPAYVHRDSPLADEEPIRDLAIGPTLGKDEQDAEFARTEAETGDGRWLDRDE